MKVSIDEFPRIYICILPQMIQLVVFWGQSYLEISFLYEALEMSSTLNTLCQVTMFPLISHCRKWIPDHQVFYLIIQFNVLLNPLCQYLSFYSGLDSHGIPMSMVFFMKWFQVGFTLLPWCKNQTEYVAVTSCLYFYFEDPEWSSLIFSFIAS